MGEVEEKLDISDTPLKIGTEDGQDDDGPKEDEFTSDVIKVYIFKTDGDEDVEIGDDFELFYWDHCLALFYQESSLRISGFVIGGTEVVAESDFPNGHAVLEPANAGRLPREKMVYMAVKDTSQGDEDMSEF